MTNTLSIPTIRTIATEREVTLGGGKNIFGGWLLSQADMAGATIATDYSQGPIVTASITKFNFIKPVYVGDVVNVYAEVTGHHTSSMDIVLKMTAERDWGRGETVTVAEADMVFVAVDAHGRPRTIR